MAVRATGAVRVTGVALCSARMHPARSDTLRSAHALRGLRRIAVFCGSAPAPTRDSGSPPGAWTRSGDVEVSASCMAVRQVGCMGALADGALAAGGEVIGVLTRGLADREIAHTGLTSLELVDTMHERKARMA